MTPLYVASGTTGLKARFKDKSGKPYKGVSRPEYLEMLTKKMIPAAKLVFKGTRFRRSFIYQQDNASAH